MDYFVQDKKKQRKREIVSVAVECQTPKRFSGNGLFGTKKNTVQT